MEEPLPIDHKDEFGEHRATVREGVQRRLGVCGTPITDRKALVGVWDVYSGRRIGHSAKPVFVFHLADDGRCRVEDVESDSPPSLGAWLLNADGTFSWLTPCPPDPTIPGLEHGAIDEDRRHLLGLPNGRFVLWNGDGSSVLVFCARPP
jgi:hypothetical protein